MRAHGERDGAASYAGGRSRLWAVLLGSGNPLCQSQPRARLREAWCAGLLKARGERQTRREGHNNNNNNNNIIITIIIIILLLLLLLLLSLLLFYGRDSKVRSRAARLFPQVDARWVGSSTAHPRPTPRASMPQAQQQRTKKTPSAM